MTMKLSVKRFRIRRSEPVVAAAAPPRRAPRAKTSRGRAQSYRR